MVALDTLAKVSESIEKGETVDMLSADGLTVFQAWQVRELWLRVFNSRLRAHRELSRIREEITRESYR